MEDMMGLFIGLMAVTMPIWIVWIVSHYRAKGRERSSLSEAELRQLDDLTEMAEKMAERIKTLESILDAENPEWRDYHGQE